MNAIIGSSVNLRVMPRNAYDFSGLAATHKMAIVVAQHIDVLPFEQVELSVRVHQAEITDGASIIVAAHPDGFTLEDAAQGFISPSHAGSVLIDSNFATRSAPAYLTAHLTGALGRLVAIVITGHQGTKAGKCAAALSVDLVMKGGVPRGAFAGYNTYRGYR
jgi:hypothetical protein